MLVKAAKKAGRSLVRKVVNDMPARVINAGYDTYSRIYKGQISLGLPVSRELISSQEEIRTSATGKLALTLYHIYLHSTGIRFPRGHLKLIIVDELEKGRLRMTENVILLTQLDLAHLSTKRLNIPKKFIPLIQKEAERRRILKDSLRQNHVPAYFESEIEEMENNHRGDYETVFYRDYTDEGKEIKFRRLVSMENVTAGDDRPSVVLVPGFANNSNCFNISNRYSIAKDMADMGFWVYLFDPRGVGVNNGRFDPYYTVDTEVDYDLPTVIRFITSRSCGKPSILMGHSMGGVVAENMAINWSLCGHLNEIDFMSTEQKKAITQVLPGKSEAERNLAMIKGIISLGSPKFFKKKSHVFFPVALWLNHLSRIFNFRHVPVQEVSRVVTELPILKDMVRFLSNHNIGELNFLVSPENHKKDKYFVERYLKIATESIPLGLGFQLLKAIYDGKGFKRMDDSGLNYSQALKWFPDDIPVFHFWGTKDHLAPLYNLRYRKYYPHKIKKIYKIKSKADLKNIRISREKSQLTDFVIDGAGHIDLLYGKIAEEIVQPLIMKIIDRIWGGWTYDRKSVKTTSKTG